MLLNAETNAMTETNIICNMTKHDTKLNNIIKTASNCTTTTTTLASGNKTPQSQSAGSRSISQVGSVASSLDLSLEGSSLAASLQNQSTPSKEKKSKKKKVYSLHLL